MNPFLGVILHGIGGFSSASVYVPIYKVKGWAWETFWILLGLTAWIIMPEEPPLLPVPAGTPQATHS